MVALVVQQGKAYGLPEIRVAVAGFQGVTDRCLTEVFGMG